MEGDPETFERLARNRPNQIAVQAVVCSKGKDEDVRWLSRDDNSVINGIIDSMHKDSVAVHHQLELEEGSDTATWYGTSVPLEEVNTPDHDDGHVPGVI